MSAPGRRMDSPKCVGRDACAALCVPSVLFAPSFCVSRTGSHPFVPSGLFARRTGYCSPAAVPNQERGADFVPPDPFAGQQRPCWCANQPFLSTPLSRRVRVANAAAVSNKSPPVSGPPPPARSSRWIVSAPACKSSSSAASSRIVFIAASTRIQRSHGEPCRVIEPW